jgi:hypothetical protein
MRAWLVLLALAGCDRVFGLGDPYEDAATVAGSDANAHGDAPGSGDAQLPADGAPLPLIAHFSFDTDYNDDSHTYAGTTVGSGVGRAIGHSGNALALGGSGCLKVSIDTPNAFSFVFWAEPTDTTGGAVLERQVTTGSSGNHAYYVYDTIGGGFGFSLWDGSQQTDMIANGEFVPSTYRHYAVTFDGTMKRVYVDGIEATPAQMVSGIVYGPNAFEYIGCDGGFQSFFRGQIDELYIYGGALDSTQVGQVP